MTPIELPLISLADKVRSHFVNDTPLNEVETIYKDRLITAHSITLNEANNDGAAAAILMRRFNIGRTTAYRDILTAKNLFGTLRSPSKEALRYMITQWATDLFAMSKKTKNMVGMEKAMERITKVNNLDKEDLDLPDPSKIQPPVQLITIEMNFIQHPMFKLCDEGTQKKIMEVYAKIMEQINLSPIKEYSDMFKIEDIPHIEIQ